MERLSNKIGLINLTMRRIMTTYHWTANEMRLSDSECDVLYALIQEPMSQSEICRTMGISKQTVNSAVRKLENKGVLSIPHGVKNAKLMLTEAGKRFAVETVGKFVRAEDAIFSQWSAEEVDTFLALNRKYLTLLREQIERF